MEASSLIGKKIRNHQIQSLIGEGGMGVVYKVIQQESQQSKAIKFMRKIHHKEAQRFLQEANVGQRLCHPNIVQIYEVGRLKDHPLFSYFMIMEYVDGTSLKDKNLLTSHRIIEICLEICAGLAAIHKANIVHRDLKPSNILITQDGTTKISDLGVVKFNEDNQFTKTGAILGTPAYMSPEQCRDSSRVDARADIYSLGVIIFELFSQRLPFKGPSDYNFLVQHSFEPPPPLSKYNPDLPSGLYSMVEKMLAKEPGKRYQNISEVESELQAIFCRLLESDIAKTASIRIDDASPSKKTIKEPAFSKGPPVVDTVVAPSAPTVVIAPSPLRPKTESPGIITRIFGFSRKAGKEEKLAQTARLVKPDGKSKKITKETSQSKRIKESRLPEGSFQDQLRSIVGKTSPLPKISRRRKKETQKISQQSQGEQVITESKVVIGKPIKDEDMIISESKVIIGETRRLPKASDKRKKDDKKR